MLQGFYTAASGMLQQQRHLNVIANNLTNVQTPGFRANRLLSQTFEAQLQARLERNNEAYIGTTERTRIVSEVADLWTHGGFTETGRPFDIGLEGYGFFNIQGEDGATYLTRNGMFDLDDEGYLVLRGQGRVLGTNNAPIQLSTSEFSVQPDGTLISNDGGGTLGQLLITVPVNDEDMEQARNGMYTAANVEAATNPSVHQGVYENSNVNLTDEQTAMIMAQRNFSSAAQALQYIDQTYAKAVNIAAL